MIKKTSGSCNTRRTAPSLIGFQQGRNEGGPPYQKRPPRGLLALIIFLKALYAHFGGPGRTDGAGNGKLLREKRWEDFSEAWKGLMEQEEREARKFMLDVNLRL